MKLAIVIVHYNTSADLARCLESLAASPPAVSHQVVVVDNASTDEGLAEVQRRYPDCLWILNEENVGYSRGCNLGLAAVEAEYTLLLNPDIVAQPGALERLLEFADDHPRAGIVGPQLLNPDGSIQQSCRRFYTFATLLLRRTFLGRIFPDSTVVRRHLMADFDHRTSRPVDWVLGGCLLARRRAVAATGPMDERFFLYFEDVDWCFRMWQAGWEVVYAPDARFTHDHRRSSASGALSPTFWMHLGSLISFYEKWGMLVWLLKKWREPLLLMLLWLLDMVGLGVAFGAAYGLRGLAGGFFAEPLYPFAEYRPLLLFTGLLASVTFLLAGRYDPRHLRRRRPLASHLQQVGVLAVLLLASTYLGHQEVISRAVLLIFLPLLAVTTALGEGAVLSALGRLERGRLSLDRTLLVAAPAVLRDWLARAGDLPAQGVDVAGYLADAGTAEVLPPLAGGTVPWLGTPDQADAVAERYRISQVVFWDLPAGGDRRWRTLGSLRRLRVRLRWQGDGVWLLAAAARSELFGGGLSAVQGAGSRRALSALARRTFSLVVGLLLGATGWLPWLWQRLVAEPRGKSTNRTVTVSDWWGQHLTLTLATGADGRARALPWQWPLAGPLLRGRLDAWGGRAVPGGTPPTPAAADEILAFWRSEPARPGLTGAWAVREGRGRAAAACSRLWHDPGGFGNLDPAAATTAAPSDRHDPGVEETCT